MSTSNLPYDPGKIDSIVECAGSLVGHALREKTNAPELQSPKQRRGSFGNALEEHFFDYKLNSNSMPDFPKVGLELKSTPVKRTAKGEPVAKERLVLMQINYMTVVHETFETSRLVKKASKILLVSYVWEKDSGPLDYKVEMAELWGLPREDMAQFKIDWETVVDKIRSGHAEDISGSDTLYLEACTKAANSTVRTRQPFSAVPVKPRAWALKASYMTAAENKLREKRQAIVRTEAERDLGLLELVRKRFDPYFGMTEEGLCRTFGIGKRGKRTPKNACALVTKSILGVEKDAKVEEFAKAGIQPKTIRLKQNGRPKEDISFPAFDYFELERTPFEDSAFYGYLQQIWLLVIYREGNDGVYRLSDVTFWQMPEKDIPEARRCYEQMRTNVRNGRADISVKSSENRCCHVRPHAQNANDVRPQPHGTPVVKKCFWLNATYMKNQIERTLATGRHR
ncbi:MAG: hypothetical protein LKI67_01310 [Olsenella sp.]|nr:hypothetical protein [Olsenella sp.]MCI1793577.1 hypothetical protein [Olsenella sp.]MCI1810482.1 hypothetical protein [Olsenella sp.]MCI1880461.1 hypothetical protein [Olsenella sp.]